jgi:methylated-DNA-protein-cysteine methyltransferase related protein
MHNDSFFDKVHSIVRLIPEGRVTSYGAIAEYIGTRGSARMVGWAMNASHRQVPGIPAHRVVNRDGLLTGKYHFGGNAVMQQLLENEGIEVVDNKIVRFDELFWDPKKELTIDNERHKNKKIQLVSSQLINFTK